MKVPALLKNKMVGYAVYVLAALNVLGYVSTKSWECLALFAATAYAAKCYMKNVVVSILAGLFVANFVFGCGRVKEGFEDPFKAAAKKLREGAETAQEKGNEEAAQVAGEAAEVAEACGEACEGKEGCKPCEQ